MGRTKNSRGHSRWLLYSMCLAAGCWAEDVWGASYLVRPDGSGDFPTISSAVAAAVNGDEIVLGDGVFTGQANRNIRMYQKTLTIRSESRDPSRCTIDCGQSQGGQDKLNRAFEFLYTIHGDPVLEGITITRGWADLGGALVFWQSSPRVRNCVFIGNSADEGGAIFCQGHFAYPTSNPILENCVIVNNLATVSPGGGVFCIQYAHMTIIACTIANNAVGDSFGGGIGVTQNSSVTIQNSIIADQWRGEAIYCYGNSSATLLCTNVFGNAGGDWVGCIADQLGINGNFSLDPLFCGPDNGNFLLREDSPCAPPGFTDCGLVGALPVGCDTLPISPSSWGKIKAAYRE